VLEKLLQSELALFFIDFPRTSDFPDDFFAAHPDSVSLATVSARLASGQYETPDAFYDDVLSVLDPFIAFFRQDQAPLRAKVFWGLATEVKSMFLGLCKDSFKSEYERRWEQWVEFKETLTHIRCAPLSHWDDWPSCNPLNDGLPDKVNPEAYFDI
jgi:hypothetical protein